MIKHKVIKAERDWEKGGSWIVTLECGHVKNVAPHFSVKVGSYSQCWECTEEKFKKE